MKRLAENLPRKVEVGLWAAVILLCLAPLPRFFHRLATNTLPANAGLLEVVFGLLGLILIWRIGRWLSLCLKAGYSIVEVSPFPGRMGRPLEVRLSIGRPGTVTLYCRRRPYRRAVIVLAEVPLGPLVHDPATNRWTFSGSVTLPVIDNAADTNRTVWPLWEIDVKMTFENGAVLMESHSLKVER